MRKLVAGILAGVGIGASAALSGVFTGDVLEYQCPDASYTRSVAIISDGEGKRDDAVICENGTYTITARRLTDKEFSVVIYDEVNHKHIDELP